MLCFNCTSSCQLTIAFCWRRPAARSSLVGVLLGEGASFGRSCRVSVPDGFLPEYSSGIAEAMTADLRILSGLLKEIRNAESRSFLSYR